MVNEDCREGVSYVRCCRLSCQGFLIGNPILYMHGVIDDVSDAISPRVKRGILISRSRTNIQEEQRSHREIVNFIVVEHMELCYV